MYLITVAVAAEDGHTGPLPMAAVARALAVSPVSANQMVRKLAERGLLSYHPYHGVELNGAGWEIAGRVLRVRRLWATFLVDRLDMTPGEADALACRLEHVTPPETAERLAAFLGSPATGPLGRRIPPGGGAGPVPAVTVLADAGVGAAFEVVSVTADRQTAQFLAAEGLEPGSLLVVVATGPDAVLVETGGSRVHLDRSLAAAMQVRVVGEGAHGA